ncbi:hypothetical protein VPH35_117023 [Triticum aestivum]
MASSDALDAAVAVGAPIPPMLRRCPATAPPRTDNHEQSGAKEVGSGGKQSYQAASKQVEASFIDAHLCPVAHVLDGINWRPGCHHRTYRTPLLQMDPNKFPSMFSTFLTDAFMSYGAGAYH